MRERRELVNGSSRQSTLQRVLCGSGAQPPDPSWGRDLNEARRYLADAPWLMLAPTAAIMASVLSLNFLGDGLRDAMDPRSWRT